MLQQEERIRMSDWYSNKCSEVKEEPNGWIRISNEVQELVAYNFGYKDTLTNTLAVEQIRRAQYIYPDDPVFKKISVYIRENKAEKLNINIGDNIPNVNIITNSSEKVSLYSICESELPNVFIASSAT